MKAQISTEKLVRYHDFREFLFHFRGLIDAMSSVQEYLELLDSRVDDDFEGAADCLGRLEAEIIDHLPYHVEGATSSFKKFSDRIYSKYQDPDLVE